ncbi:MAG: hypothetical protein KC656_01240 [Myxococcales bacterium]|nr:hypothetical protein [Myxococcales bacterium]MCB9693933.1 hypothetical protein [Alphaproteobacteria bacterium]
MLLTVVGIQTAASAPILWPGEPDPAQESRVFDLPDAGDRLERVDLRRLDLDTSGKAIEALSRALADVRAYETRLDGELVIMADLEAALGRVALLRDGKDRETVFRALAYQGFAVDRYFASALASDEAASPWRAPVDGRQVVRPWRDAVAVEPGREATAYDISEAPQRIAFNDLRRRLLDVLPAGVGAGELPEGATLWLDGVEVASDGTNTRVPPGVHYVHVMLEGAVILHDRVELAPTDTLTVDVPLADAVLDGFLASLTPETPVPDALLPALKRVGGEIWVGRSGEKGPVVLAVSAAGVRPVEVPKPGRDRSPTVDAEGGLSVHATVGAGWMSSADFYLAQYDVAPATGATVNAAVLSGGLGVAFDAGLLRVGGGLDVLLPPGPHHTAPTGDAVLRARPAPHVYAGTRYGGLVAGFLFPWHPLLGARASLPAGPLEITVDGRMGLPGDLPRAEADIYRTSPIWSTTAGVTWRLRP